MTRRGAAGVLVAVLGVVAIALAGRADESPSAGPAATAEAATSIAPAESLAIRLIDGARGADPVVCALASFAVEGRYGWGGPDPAFEALEVEGETAEATVRWTLSFEADEAAVRALAAALGDADACARRLAAIRLGRTRSAAGVGALLEALAAPAAETRRAGALGLGFAGDDPADAAAVEGLLAALDDPDPRVRASAAWALGRLDADRAIPALVELLESDADARVRRNAALALGEID